MTPTTAYKVLSVAQTVYMDGKGKPINGFALTVDLKDYDETIIVNVPTTDPDTARKSIEKMLADRQALAELGE